jgi:hypothetical protein
MILVWDCDDLKKIKIIYKNIQDQENDGRWNWKKKKKKDHHLY